MGFTDFLRSIIDGLTPPNMSDSPNCSKCLNCKARIIRLPSGKEIRVFTCPCVGQYDEYQGFELPSVDPNDPNSIIEYTKKYLEKIDYIYNLMGNSSEQPGDCIPLKTNDFKPITRYEELKYCTENIYNCGHFKPCLYIDHDGSSYMIENEMIQRTSYSEEYFDNLSPEDKNKIRDLG